MVRMNSTTTFNMGRVFDEETRRWIVAVNGFIVHMGADDISDLKAIGTYIQAVDDGEALPAH